MTTRAENVLFPIGGPGNSSVILYTAGTNHLVNAIPAAFCGKFARITVSGGDLWFFFTPISNAEVDRAVAATDEGTQSNKLGGFIKDGDSREGIVPTFEGGTYFAREATAAATVTIEITSD